MSAVCPGSARKIYSPGPGPGKYSWVSVQEKIESVAALASTLPLEDIEWARLEADLGRVEQRLGRREYLKSSFADNTYNLVERYNETLTELCFYSEVGRTWGKLIEVLKLSVEHTVLDIAPGAAPKIELGLYYADFAGEVVAMDQNLAALGQLERFLGCFNHRFTLKTREGNLFEPQHRSFSLVLANHILDDLVIAAEANRQGLQLEDAYGREQTIVELWKQVLARGEEHLTTEAQRIAGALSPWVAKAGTLLLVQYPSYFERLFDLDAVSAFTQKLLEEIAGVLSHSGFKRDSDLPAQALGDAPGIFGPENCRLLRRP